MIIELISLGGVKTILGFLTALGISGIMEIGLAVIVLTIFLWAIAVPYRLAIEIAGRLLGEDPDIDNITALLLIAVMNFSILLGLLLFIIKFYGEMPLWKVILLAILSTILASIIISLLAHIMTNPTVIAKLKSIVF